MNCTLGHLQTLVEETWEFDEVGKCYRFPLSKVLETESMLNGFTSECTGSLHWTGFVQCIDIHP